MRLITKRTLDRYAQAHPEVAQQLADWCAMIQASAWASGDAAVRSSSFRVRTIPPDRLTFKILGNAFRLLCSVRYADPVRGFHGIVRVEFIGTHSEYDRVDAKTVTLTP